MELHEMAGLAAKKINEGRDFMPLIISTGELFADLQVSLTELFLIEMLGDGELVGEFDERRRGNQEIVEGITAVMKDRFSPEEIAVFLRNGFPRQVDLSAVLPGS